MNTLRSIVAATTLGLAACTNPVQRPSTLLHDEAARLSAVRDALPNQVNDSTIIADYDVVHAKADSLQLRIKSLTQSPAWGSEEADLRKYQYDYTKQRITNSLYVVQWLLGAATGAFVMYGVGYKQKKKQGEQKTQIPG